MSNKNLIPLNDAAPDIFFADSELLTPDYFLKNYKRLIVPYIGKGRPSSDTLRSYFTHIDQFVAWCFKQQIHPLAVKEHHLLKLRNILFEHGYKEASINLKFAAYKQFYKAAVKLGVVKENPAVDIHGTNQSNEDPKIRFLSQKDLQALLDAVDPNCPPILYYRDILLIVLMAREGLRSVEVQRLNFEQINWEYKTIYVFGKGHNDYIYPSSDTLSWLEKYRNIAMSAAKKDAAGTPVFFSTSNNNYGNRLSRQALRDVINKLLKKINLKQSGLSCHILRHTCGTLLYAATKDVIAVKETLRHRDTKMTTHYAHLQDRLLNRYTDAIAVNPTSSGLNNRK